MFLPRWFLFLSTLFLSVTLSNQVAFACKGCHCYAPQNLIVNCTNVGCEDQITVKVRGTSPTSCQVWSTSYVNCCQIRENTLTGEDGCTVVKLERAKDLQVDANNNGLTKEANPKLAVAPKESGN